MSEASHTPPGITTQGASFVATSVDHPRPNRTDAESIRLFLRLYDQYSKEVTSRAQQITAAGFTTTEAVRPVNLKFCVDPEYLESAIALDFIEGVDSYDYLSNSVLRSYLDEKAAESEKTVTLEILDTIVARELRMDMSDKNDRSRIESLYVSYHALLRRIGISWLLNSNQKVAVGHVVSSIRPVSLKERLQSDLYFAHHDLKKDFKRFMKHAVRFLEGFQLVDTGPKSKKRSGNRDGNKQPRSGNSGDKFPSRYGQSTKTNKGSGSTRRFPDFPHSPCKAKGLKHLSKNCPDSTKAEKDKMLADLTARRANYGPARGTRSKNGSSTASNSTKPKKDSGIGGGTKRRISHKKKTKTDTVSNSDNQPACPIKVSDGQATLEGTGRCDESREDSIVSAALAERAVIRGIGKIAAIKTVRLSVALKADAEPQKFSFSRQWTAPRTVLHLSSGQLVLANVKFLIADDNLACEDFLIGLPVFQHLQVDTCTLLEQNRSVLDGSDCSHLGNPTMNRGGVISLMMIARINRILETQDESDNSTREPAPDMPHVNYYTARNEEYPFPDQSLLDLLDDDQEEEIRNGIAAMKENARKNGLPAEHQDTLNGLIDSHFNVFRTGFSAGPPADFQPLKIELTPEARPTKVRLRNYSREQREFLAAFVDQLVRNRMAYVNPTSPWACAPLLVPNPGSARFRFTVDLRPVNKFTVKHQYPMPNLSMS